MPTIGESCYFFQGPEEEDLLYGSVYLPPVAIAGQTGVVLASPVGRERLRIYHESANLARYLARRGHPVIRFDYRGEGESSGEFSEATLTTRLEDIATMSAELKRRAGVEQICLVGFRMGGLLAAMAAEDLGIQRMILCDPVCSPKKFAKGMLRSNIVLQSQYFGEVFKKEPALREDLQQGGTVSVYGFQMGQPFLEELEQTDPEPHLSGYQGKAAIIYISTRESAPKKDVARWCELLGQGSQCETICAVMAFSWASRKMWMPSLEPLNSAVAGWLENNA